MRSERCRRRIWCETVPPEELARTASLLGRYALDPIVAVFPATEARAIAGAFLRFEQEGLRPVLWPMLADADGRWASAQTVDRFVRFAEWFTQELEGAGVQPEEILVDLEPPIGWLRGVLRGGPWSLLRDSGASPSDFARSERILRAFRARLASRDIALSAAVAPLVVLEGAGGRGYERLLGTPVLGTSWDIASVMAYSSMFEGWSRSLLGRDDARSLLAFSTRAVVRCFGERAEVSLGAVGTGALGDEPVYRSPAELEDDVAVASAHGATRLALFDLGGVLRRPPAEAWLDAFTRGSAALRSAPPTARARLVVATATLFGQAYDAFGGKRLRGGETSFGDSIPPGSSA